MVLRTVRSTHPTDAPSASSRRNAGAIQEGSNMRSPKCLIVGFLIGVAVATTAWQVANAVQTEAELVHEPGEDPQELQFPKILPEEEGTVPNLVAALVVGHNMKCLVVATAVPYLDVPQEPELEHARSPVAVSCVRTEIAGQPDNATAGPFKVLRVK